MNRISSSTTQSLHQSIKQQVTWRAVSVCRTKTDLSQTSNFHNSATRNQHDFYTHCTIVVIKKVFIFKDQIHKNIIWSKGCTWSLWPVVVYWVRSLGLITFWPTSPIYSILPQSMSLSEAAVHLKTAQHETENTSGWTICLFQLPVRWKIHDVQFK